MRSSSSSSNDNNNNNNNYYYYYYTSVFGADVYPHMPIIRPHATLFHERCISSVTFTSAHLYGNVYMRVGVARALADSSDFGLLGEQSSQNV